MMKLLPFCTWLACFLVLSLSLGCQCGAPRRTARSKRDLVRVREAAAVSRGLCGTRLPRGKRSVSGAERRSGQPADNNQAHRRTSVYFSGRGDQMRLKPSVEVPRGNFTLETWIKPEGGQRSPNVIAGLRGFIAASTTFRRDTLVHRTHTHMHTCTTINTSIF